MKRYERIQIEEREEIMRSIAGGKSLREIANKLNRKVSGITREIRMNYRKYRYSFPSFIILCVYFSIIK